MWILALNNSDTQIFKNLDKALNAMADQIMKGKDAILLDGSSSYMSWSVKYSPLGDLPKESWQKLDTFKKDTVMMYQSITKAEVMEERGIRDD
tara:strand:+ start:387 stop:665 length:279 start_codon:yes stop_codon:yes gene_type:complete